MGQALDSRRWRDGEEPNDLMFSNRRSDTWQTP